MSTPHINANKGDFSDIVLMSGDPLRVQYIAKNFLKNTVEISNVRNMLAFTGMYEDQKISLMSHGIGIPSCSIYTKELITNFGVKKILRLGSCGAIQRDLQLHDIIIGLGACTDSRVNRLRFQDYDFAAIADFNMLCNAVNAAKKLKIDVKVGNLFSTDLFYHSDKNLCNLLEKYGILGIEMETAGIYGIAAEHGIKALTICTVSDHVHTHKQLSPIDREKTFNSMIHIALNSIV